MTRSMTRLCRVTSSRGKPAAGFDRPQLVGGEFAQFAVRGRERPDGRGVVAHGGERPGSVVEFGSPGRGDRGPGSRCAGAHQWRCELLGQPAQRGDLDARDARSAWSDPRGQRAPGDDAGDVVGHQHGRGGEQIVPLDLRQHLAQGGDRRRSVGGGDHPARLHPQDDRGCVSSGFGMGRIVPTNPAIGAESESLTA